MANDLESQIAVAREQVAALERKDELSKRKVKLEQELAAVNGELSGTPEQPAKPAKPA